MTKDEKQTQNLKMKIRGLRNHVKKQPLTQQEREKLKADYERNLKMEDHYRTQAENLGLKENIIQSVGTALVIVAVITLSILSPITQGLGVSEVVGILLLAMIAGIYTYTATPKILARLPGELGRAKRLQHMKETHEELEREIRHLSHGVWIAQIPHREWQTVLRALREKPEMQDYFRQIPDHCPTTAEWRQLVEMATAPKARDVDVRDVVAYAEARAAAAIRELEHAAGVPPTSSDPSATQANDHRGAS